MKREELIKNKAYNVTKIQNELFRQLQDYLDSNNISRTQFAKDLGVTKGYVSQILNGDFDFKLSKLVELSLAIGKIPEIEFKIIDEENIKNSKDFKFFILDESRFKNPKITAKPSKKRIEKTLELEQLKIAR